jgi:hypothetical protein
MCSKIVSDWETEGHRSFPEVESLALSYSSWIFVSGYWWEYSSTRRSISGGVAAGHKARTMMLGLDLVAIAVGVDFDRVK